MAKDKKRTIDESEKKETLFYYEIIGVIVIIFSVAILGKLGKLGTFFTTFFKAAFGNWYWLVILFILFIGIYSLFVHQKFNFKNNIFIGAIFISLGLLMFAHFPLHEYLAKNSKNYFSDAWSIFLNFINTGNDEYLGGGIFGTVLFYAIFYLFGKYGVVLFSLLIIVLGISLLLNKSVVDIFRFFTSKLKKTKKYIRSFNNFFKYELGDNKGKEKSVLLPVKSYSGIIQSKENNDKRKNTVDNYSKILNDLLGKYDVEYKIINSIISYQIITFSVRLLSYLDLSKFIDELTQSIAGKILYGKSSGILVLQIEIPYKAYYAIKEIASNNLEKRDNFDIAIDSNNNKVTIDINKNPNILILGCCNSGVRTFVSSLIFIFYNHYYSNQLLIKIYDVYNDFDSLKDIIKICGELFLFLDEIKREVDNRLELLKKYDSIDFNEYNQRVSMNLIEDELLKRNVYIINHTDLDSSNLEIFTNRLMFINQTANKVGINVILIERNDKNVNSNILSIFENEVILKCNANKFRKEVLGNVNPYYLLRNGDAIIKYKNNEVRCQLPLISKDDIESCIKVLK